MNIGGIGFQAADSGFARGGINSEKRDLEKANEYRVLCPQLELVTVSILPRPGRDFWSSLANATQPIVRSGGLFRGPLLNGTITQAAVTGRFNAQEDTIQIFARVQMMTHDGVTIYKNDRGIWRGSNGAVGRLVSGKGAAASEYYFIGLLKYTTSDSRYRWLEEGDYLSHGGMHGTELKISQFRVVPPVSLAEWSSSRALVPRQK